VEGAGCQSRQLPCVPVFKRNDYAIGSQIRDAFERIVRKTGLGLLSICNYRRAGVLKELYGFPQRAVGDAGKLVRGHLAVLQSETGRNQFRRPRNAPNRFSRYVQPVPSLGLRIRLSKLTEPRAGAQ
jgi:hypothetical protein